MRPPAMASDLWGVAVPGAIVLGALAMLVMQTPLGSMIFSGPVAFLVVSLLVGVLVLGYLTAALQEVLAGRWSPWALPPTSHLDEGDHTVRLSAASVERAGFGCEGEAVTVRLGLAYALERSLAGAWGTPEGGWDRAAYLQRIALAMALSALLALGFLASGLSAGFDAGLRSHAGTVLVLGSLTAWLVSIRARQARREAVVELLADARAMIMDRGEHQEVRRILDELGLSLTGEEPTVGVPR